MIHPLMDSGRMPNLRKLVDGGTSGELQTLMPALSPMLWTTIATGRPAADHGILGFYEPDPQSGTVRPASSSSRRVKAIWNMLAEHGLRASAVNWMASHPAEEGTGIIVSNALASIASSITKPIAALPQGTVTPSSKSDLFRDLMVFPTDLSGDDLARFIPELEKVDQATDKRPLELARLLSQTFTTHAAATWILEHSQWDFAGVYYDCIDRAGHSFMPFHPPRMEGVADADFAIYHAVMESVYECHDLLLGRLLQLAGPDATVILLSDHGFRSGADRPHPGAAPEAWHREHGVFCASGPGIRSDELVFGANLMDITPTLLSLFGLPVGKDMPGRVLAEIYEQAPELKFIPTWETALRDRTPIEALSESWDASAMMDQLAALGYIDPRSDSEKQSLSRTRLDQTFNLGRSLLGTGRPGEAIPVLREALEAEPADPNIRLCLGMALAQVRRFDEAAEIARAMIAGDSERPLAHLLLAEIEIARGHGDAALENLQAIERSTSIERHALDGSVGRAMLLLKRFRDAEGRFRRALAHSTRDGALHRGLSAALWYQHKIQESAQSALDAVGCDYASADGHFLLGRALAQVGRVEAAESALRVCLRLNPRHVRAQNWLAAVQRSVVERPGSAPE